ncbi:MAG: cytochrome c oxidase assembly protein [Alphaproteobacteria bacterium]|nr:cytochrome c oxidase assembly protein [Alphaproteobacteria bacterium]
MNAAWELDPAVALPLAISLLLYGFGLSRLWRRAGAGRSVTRAQAACFAGGWLALFVALVSPLHEYGEHLFVAHMIEHEVLTAVAAPLLALSRPIGVFLHALPRSWRPALVGWAHAPPIAAAWTFLTAPLVATVLHGIAIWVWHVPALLDATLTNEMLHRLQHMSFLVTALFFWWAILRRPAADYGLGTVHVFATMIHTGLLGALLTLAPHVLYPLQTADAPLFGLKPLEDQQLAGLFMWVPGGAIYLCAGLWLLGRWLVRPPLSRIGNDCRA